MMVQAGGLFSLHTLWVPMAKKRNGLFFRFSVIVLLFIGGLLGVFVWQQFNRAWSSWQHRDDPDNTFTLYAGFGIWLPNQYSVHGIDVSRYQKRINWSLVSKMKDAGVQLQFAFIKATEGSDMLDEQFLRNWRRARQHGMLRGAYHFFRESSGGHEQALFFIKNVSLEPGDLAPVLDVETYNGNNVDVFLTEIEVWLKLVEDHYGVKPILYSNAAFYNQYLHDRFADYPLWVAHYQNRLQPRVDRAWQFWQHSETGKVNGIRSKVDFNVFNGSLEELKDLCVPLKKR